MDYIVIDDIMILNLNYHKRMTFNDAELYCKLLMVNNFDDWYIPNKHDMTKIHEYTKIHKSVKINDIFMPMLYWIGDKTLAYFENNDKDMRITTVYGDVYISSISPIRKILNTL